MAKGKHSVALFEVISAGKTSSRASSLSTPKWWFKKQKTDAPVAPAAASPPVESSAPAPHSPGVDLKLDPDQQRIKLNVTYNSAIVAGFTVVVVVGLAYIIGSRMSRGPAPAVAGSTAQIRSGPVTPGVLDIAPVTRQAPLAASQVQHETTPPPQNTATPIAQTPAQGQNAQRTIGFNYLVVQSYPTEQMANDARDPLAQNGIASTVEVELKGWGTSASSKYSVVGLVGFDRIRNNPAYAAYLKSIEDLNSKIVKSPKYSKFQPVPYSWKAQSSR